MWTLADHLSDRGANAWYGLRAWLLVQEFLPRDFEVANYFWSENPDLLYRQVSTYSL